MASLASQGQAQVRRKGKGHDIIRNSTYPIFNAGSLVEGDVGNVGWVSEEGNRDDLIYNAWLASACYLLCQLFFGWEIPPPLLWFSTLPDAMAAV